MFPKIFLLHKVVHDAKKVEKHWFILSLVAWLLKICCNFLSVPVPFSWIKNIGKKFNHAKMTKFKKPVLYGLTSKYILCIMAALVWQHKKQLRAWCFQFILWPRNIFTLHAVSVFLVLSFSMKWNFNGRISVRLCSSIFWNHFIGCDFPNFIIFESCQYLRNHLWCIAMWNCCDKFSTFANVPQNCFDVSSNITFLN